jgi:hypothetical protein
MRVGELQFPAQHRHSSKVVKLPEIYFHLHCSTPDITCPTLHYRNWHHCKQNNYSTFLVLNEQNNLQMKLLTSMSLFFDS